LEKSNKILAALAVSDNIFLISLFAVYLRHFYIDLFNKYSIVCKLTVFSTYVSGFLSAWFIVEFSIERVIAVYFPIQRNDICSSSRSKFSLSVIFLSAMIIYAMSLVTSGVEYFESEEMDMCMPLNQWEKVSRVMVLYDVIFVIFMPFVIISITNTLIVVKLLNRASFKFMSIKSISKSASIGTNFSADLRKSMRLRESIRSKNRQNEVNLFLNQTYDNGNKHHGFDSSSMLSFKESRKYISNMTNRMKRYSKTTTVLFTISTTFLILNCPIAILKLWYIIKNIHKENALEALKKNSNRSSDENFRKFNGTSNANTTDHFITSPFEELAERISCYLYYLNFSLNFFLYNLNGSKFRKAILAMFLKKKAQSFIRRPVSKDRTTQNHQSSGFPNSYL
jgi:hypothetical protein